MSARFSLQSSWDPEASARRLTSIINVALGFLGIIAVVIVLMGGFKYMISGGNEEKVGEAKKLIVSGIIGLAIILSAWGNYELRNFKSRDSHARGIVFSRMRLLTSTWAIFVSIALAVSLWVCGSADIGAGEFGRCLERRFGYARSNRNQRWRNRPGDHSWETYRRLDRFCCWCAPIFLHALRRFPWMTAGGDEGKREECATCKRSRTPSSPNRDCGNVVRRSRISWSGTSQT